MVISIDWLQLHFNGQIVRSEKYKWETLEFSTQVFLSVENVYLDNYYIASVLSHPRSQILDPDMVIIKIINKVLYDDKLWEILDNFVKSLGLIYKGITRLDICADFNTFKFGKHPENLINEFMKLDIRKVGQGKGTVHFEQSDRMKYQTLKFGTSKSLICCYLYNKSKELQQVKMKDYIIDKWRASGIDCNRDVWRLEFSIKGDSLALLDEETGELLKPNLDTLRDYEFLSKLFFTLQKQYFRFKRKTKDKNKSRWPDIELFNYSPTLPRRLFITETGDGSRADKIFLRKLDGLNNEIRKYAKFRENFLEELICEFAIDKGLADYYIKRINGRATEALIYLNQIKSENYDELQKNKRAQNLNQDLFSREKHLINLKSNLLDKKLLNHYEN